MRARSVQPVFRVEEADNQAPAAGEEGRQEVNMEGCRSDVEESALATVGEAGRNNNRIDGKGVMGDDRRSGNFNDSWKEYRKEKERGVMERKERMKER